MVIAKCPKCKKGLVKSDLNNYKWLCKGCVAMKTFMMLRF